MAATRPMRAAAAASKEPGGMSLYAIERRKLKRSSVPPTRPHARQLIAAKTVPHLRRVEDDGPVQQSPRPSQGSYCGTEPLCGGSVDLRRYRERSTPLP